MSDQELRALMIVVAGVILAKAIWAIGRRFLGGHRVNLDATKPKGAWRS